MRPVGGVFEAREFTSGFYSDKMKSNSLTKKRKNMNLSKKIKLVRLMLILMAALGVFFSLLQGLELSFRLQNYDDPFPTIVILPLSLAAAIFFLVLSEKLYKGKRWAWHASFWLFTLFTIGDLLANFLIRFDVVLIVVAVVHGLAAYSLYKGKEEYMSFSSHPEETS